MMTSRDHRQPTTFASHGDHWLALTATLCRKSTDEFSDWLQGELVLLEDELDAYATPRSRGQSLSRKTQDPVS